MNDSDETVCGTADEDELRSQSGSPSILGELQITKPATKLKQVSTSTSSRILVLEEEQLCLNLKRGHEQCSAEEDHVSNSPEYPPLSAKLKKVSTTRLKYENREFCNSTQDFDSQDSSLVYGQGAEFDVIEEHMSFIEDKINILTKMRNKGTLVRNTKEFTDLKQKMLDVRLLLSKLNSLHQKQREQLTRSSQCSSENDRAPNKDIFVLASKQKQLLGYFKRYEELLGKAKSLKSNLYLRDANNFLPGLQKQNSSGICQMKKHTTIDHECIEMSSVKANERDPKCKETIRNIFNRHQASVNSTATSSDNGSFSVNTQTKLGPAAEKLTILGQAKALETITNTLEQGPAVANKPTSIVSACLVATPTGTKQGQEHVSLGITTTDQGTGSVVITGVGQASVPVAATLTTLGQRPVSLDTTSTIFRQSTGSITSVSTKVQGPLSSTLTTIRQGNGSVSIVPTTLLQGPSIGNKPPLAVPIIPYNFKQGPHVTEEPTNQEQRSSAVPDRPNSLGQDNLVSIKPLSSMPNVATETDNITGKVLISKNVQGISLQPSSSSSSSSSSTLLPNSQLVYLINTPNTRTTPITTILTIPTIYTNTSSSMIKLVPTIAQLKSTARPYTAISGFLGNITSSKRDTCSAVSTNTAPIMKPSCSRPPIQEAVKASLNTKMSSITDNSHPVSMPTNIISKGPSTGQTKPADLQNQTKNLKEQSMCVTSSNVPGNLPVDINTLLRHRVIEPGRNVLSVDLQGKKFTASLIPNGNIQSTGGEIFLTPMVWLKAVTGSKTALRQLQAYNKILYKSKPLSSYSLPSSITQDDNSTKQSSTKYDQQTYNRDNQSNSSSCTSTTAWHGSRVEHRQTLPNPSINLAKILTNNCWVRLISDNELIPTESFLPADFWSTSFESIDLDPKLFAF